MLLDKEKCVNSALLCKIVTQTNSKASLTCTLQLNVTNEL